jgi:multiple sugar transport system substrate-binding protein
VGGKVAMIFRTQGTINYFRRNAKDFEWDVAPPPGKEAQKTEGSLICFTITKPGKSPDNAWDLLKFMGGPDGSKIFAEQGAFIPAYKKSAELVKPGASPPASYPANIQLFAKAMEYNTNVNFTENTENARNVYRQEFDKVFNCQESAQDVLNRVRKDVEEALSGKF